MPGRRPSSHDRRPPARRPTAPDGGGRSEGARAAPSGAEVELEVAPGLVDVAGEELDALTSRLRLEPKGRREGDDHLRLLWPAEVEALHALRTVTAVARVWRFDVPRPRALLGDAALRTLRSGVRDIVERAPAPFAGMRVSAAGRDSAILRRLTAELADAAGLRVDPAAGDLLVRVRPGAAGSWEVAVRTTPRPLTVRPWRVCDRPGGLDAAVAAAAVRLAGVRHDDRVLAAMAGSGTLLIERGLAGAAARLDGFDLDPEAVACARANAAGAGLDAAHLWQADVRALDVPDGVYDLILVDPPWGDAVGRHHQHPELYRAMLDELARVAASRARMVVLTHEVRLAEGLLDGHRGWVVAHARRVWHGGHRPLLAVLERREQRARL